MMKTHLKKVVTVSIMVLAAAGFFLSPVFAATSKALGVMNTDPKKFATSLKAVRQLNRKGALKALARNPKQTAAFRQMAKGKGTIGRLSGLGGMKRATTQASAMTRNAASSQAKQKSYIF